MNFEDLGILVKPGRSRYATICPQCDSKREHHKGALCLTVNNEPNNRWYKCNHCNWSGNIDVADKYVKVTEKAKMPSSQRAFTIKVREYLAKRGISMNTAKELKLYEGEAFGKTQICFPFFMHMTLVNVKFLNMDWKKGDNYSKWVQLPKEIGTRIIPFGIHRIKTHDDQGVRLANNVCIITEGEWDCLTWIECGYQNTVSVPQGAPSLKAKEFTNEFKYLEDTYVKSIFEHIDLFIISGDGDEAGKNLTNHIAMILGKEKCRIVQYPVGYKDINEVFVGNKDKNLPALGKDGVVSCYENVSPLPIRGVIKVSAVYDDLMKIRKGGFEPGYGCGVPEVDKLFTMKRKLIMFISGIPGAGKSVWTRWWLTKMIQHNVDLNFKWAMFTPENRPVAREYAKIVEVLTGQYLEEGVHNSMNDEAMKKALRWAQKHIFIISPDKVNFEDFGGTVEKNRVNTIMSIQKYLIYLKKTENIFGYVIDAWNKIEHEQPKHQTETTFISEQLDKMIDFNDYWDLAGIIVVHPKKIEMTGQNYKMPSLYDIKGSSAWKEKADLGVIIHRYKMKMLTKENAYAKTGKEFSELDEDEKWEVVPNAPTIVFNEKVRFEETGTEGRVKMEMKGCGQFFVLDSNAIKAKAPSKVISKTKPDPNKKIESSFIFEEEESDVPF